MDNYDDLLSLVYHKKQPDFLIGAAGIVVSLYLMHLLNSKKVYALVGIFVGAGLCNTVTYWIWDEGTPDYINLYPNYPHLDTILNLPDLTMVVAGFFTALLAGWESYKKQVGLDIAVKM